MKRFCSGLFILCVLMTASLAGCRKAAPVNAVNADAVEVSLIRLIAAPEAYEGKAVRVVGVGALSPDGAAEGNGVYLSGEDFKQSLTVNGLWIALSDRATPLQEAAGFNGRYVVLEGVFDSGSAGPDGRWSGGVTDITRYELWSA